MLFFKLLTFTLVTLGLGASEVVFNCDFSVAPDDYECEVSNTAIEVDDTEVSIEEIHLANHTNDHVTRLRASFLNSFTYLPINIGQLFPRLQKMIIDEVKFIKKENFRGMENLSTLYLNLNQIETLPDDAFAELPNLQFLSLGNGKIKVLPENIFQQNPNLNSFDILFGPLENCNKLKSTSPSFTQSYGFSFTAILAPTQHSTGSGEIQQALSMRIFDKNKT